MFLFHFVSMLAPKCLPKPPQIHQKSLKNEGQISGSILMRFLNQNVLKNRPQTLKKHWVCIGICSTSQPSAFLPWYTGGSRFLIEFHSILAPKIDQNAMKNRSKTVLIFWFSFGWFFCGCWLRFGGLLAPMLAPKSSKKGGGTKEGGDLWQRLRAKSAQGYPQTLKIRAQGPPGLKNNSKCHPFDPKKR